MENINWYPGHMKKTRELIDDMLSLVSVVIEVCDARIPHSSRNPVIEELTNGKKKILILNKSDLADGIVTKEWLDVLKKENSLALNCKSGQGINKLLSKLKDIRKSNEKQSQLRLMVVGVPNSGKSSLINRLAGKKSTQTGNRPGVTKGKQWLRLDNGIQLLDTPGILWPKFEDPEVGRNLAFCGSIKDEIMDIPGLALELIIILAENYPELILSRYGIDISRYDFGSDGQAGQTEKTGQGGQTYMGEIRDQALKLMDEIAGNRGCLLQGKRIDYERTGRLILDEFRSGLIGRITLERQNEKRRT